MDRKHVDDDDLLIAALSDNIRQLIRDIKSVENAWRFTLCQVVVVHWRQKVRLVSTNHKVLSLSGIFARARDIELYCEHIQAGLQGSMELCAKVTDERTREQTVKTLLLIGKYLNEYFMDRMYQKLLTRLQLGVCKDIKDGLIETIDQVVSGQQT